MALAVWTLKTCDTCRKALAFLREEGIEHEVRDVRADGVSPELVSILVVNHGEDAVVNRRSTTWRSLSEETRGSDVVDLLMAHPTLLKRPAFVAANGESRVGFTDEVRSWLRGQPGDGADQG